MRSYGSAATSSFKGLAVPLVEQVNDDADDHNFPNNNEINGVSVLSVQNSMQVKTMMHPKFDASLGT
jgi:hypothetical protein